MWDWAIYGALIASSLAGVGALAFVAVRVLGALRDLKRLRRHVFREIDRVAEQAEAAADKLAELSDTSELQASTDRLRVTLARFAVLRSAWDEATGSFGRIAAVYPRK